jgi:hypothetical protein
MARCQEIAKEARARAAAAGAAAERAAAALEAERAARQIAEEEAGEWRRRAEEADDDAERWRLAVVDGDDEVQGWRDDLERLMEDVNRAEAAQCAADARAGALAEEVDVWRDTADAAAADAAAASEAHRREVARLEGLVADAVRARAQALAQLQAQTHAAAAQTAQARADADAVAKARAAEATAAAVAGQAAAVAEAEARLADALAQGDELCALLQERYGTCLCFCEFCDAVHSLAYTFHHRLPFFRARVSAVDSAPQRGRSRRHRGGLRGAGRRALRAGRGAPSPPPGTARCSRSPPYLVIPISTPPRRPT